MKANAFLFIIPVFLLLISSCEKERLNITPSNQLSTQTHSITAFTDLIVSDPFVVYVEFSNTEESLRIEANDNLHSFIEIRQSGESLSISLEDHVNIKNGSVVLKAYLKTKELKELKASGTTDIILQDPLVGEILEVELEGASKLSGQLQLNQLEAYLNGASIMDIEGTAQRFDLDATGASHMTDYDFATDRLFADLNGGSSASMTVNQTIEVTASGASNIYYKGNGVIEKLNVSGGSNVIKQE